LTTSVNIKRRVGGALGVILILAALWFVPKIFSSNLHKSSESNVSDRHIESFSGQTMGTTYNIQIALTKSNLTSTERTSVEQRIETLLVEVNAQMSTYIPTSEISGFNNAKSTDWQPVAPEFAAVTELAKKVWQQSTGAFDPTVLPIVEAWGFGAKSKTQNTPTAKELEMLRAKVGMKHVEVQLNPSALRKLHPEVSLDLSAVAKGHGVDRVAEELEKLGYQDYLVEIGGEVRVKGLSGRGDQWTLGIEKPSENGRSAQRLVRLKNEALATSGDYRNYREIDGKRFSHIIDPVTGEPVNHRLVSSSVIAETCAEADSWSTALFVLGPERALVLANKLNLQAYMLVMTDKGIVEVESDSFLARDKNP